MIRVVDLLPEAGVHTSPPERPNRRFAGLSTIDPMRDPAEHARRRQEFLDAELARRAAMHSQKNEVRR